MSIPFASSEAIPGLAPASASSCVHEEEGDVLLSPAKELSQLTTEEDYFYSIVFHIRTLVPVTSTASAPSSSSSSLSTSVSTRSYIDLAFGLGKAFIQQKIGLGGDGAPIAYVPEKQQQEQEQYAPDITPISLKRTLSSIRTLARHFVGVGRDAAVDEGISQLLRAQASTAAPSAEDVQRFFRLCFEDPSIVCTLIYHVELYIKFIAKNIHCIYQVRSKGMEGFLGGPAVGSPGGGTDVRDNIQGSETGTEKAALAVILRSVPFVTIQIPAGIYMYNMYISYITA